MAKQLTWCKCSTGSSASTHQRTASTSARCWQCIQPQAARSHLGLHQRVERWRCCDSSGGVWQTHHLHPACAAGGWRAGHDACVLQDCASRTRHLARHHDGVEAQRAPLAHSALRRDPAERRKVLVGGSDGVMAVAPWMVRLFPGAAAARLAGLDVGTCNPPCRQLEAPVLLASGAAAAKPL